MKYIIEFEDKPSMYEDGMKFYKCIQAPWWGLSERVIERLTPYQPDHNADIGKKVDGDCISRQAEIDALEKCYTCKHVYQRVYDADTLYCRCRKGCRYEEFKPKRSTGNTQWHEGKN